MQKILLSFGLLVVIFVPFSARAVFKVACESQSCLSNATTEIALEPGCETGTSTCYGIKSRVYSCTTCKSGYTRVQRTTTLSTCDGTISYWGCDKNLSGAVTECTALSFTTCSGPASMNGLEHCSATREYCWGGVRVATCTACDDGYELTDDKLWLLECTNAYERKVCSESTAVEIKCKMGWYMNTAKTGCVACPENTSTGSGMVVGGLSEVPGCGLNTDTTKSGALGCYYGANSGGISLDGSDNSCSYSDDSGTYKYTSDCYYSDLTKVEFGGDLLP